jgi:hypothetical protein
MNPSMIRQTAGQTHYAVQCPECHGRRFIDSFLCRICGGDGSILIPESHPVRKAAQQLHPRNRLKIRQALIAVVAILALVIFGIILVSR